MVIDLGGKAFLTNVSGAANAHKRVWQLTFHADPSIYQEESAMKRVATATAALNPSELLDGIRLSLVSASSSLLNDLRRCE